MSNENKPGGAPDDLAGGTMVAIPRPAALQQPRFGGFSAPQPAPVPDGSEAGGTMVGMQRPNFSALGAPLPTPANVPAEAGGTMVGMQRAGMPGTFGAFAAPGQPHAQPNTQPHGIVPPEAGGTMVGMQRVQIGGQFGGFAAPAPAHGNVPAEAGGTMVGMQRVGAPGQFGGFAAPAPSQGFVPPEAGGTMVGMQRVGAPGQFGGFAAPAQSPGFVPPEAGGTMVGMQRVGAPGQFGGFAAPAPAPGNVPPEAGGTMVGMQRVGAPGQFGGFGPPAASSWAAPPPPTKPSGPPPAYELLAHLGGGELGQVFHAKHRETGREVALRIIRPDIAAVPGAVEALRDVVALSQNVQHNHLGKIFELDESASPTLVLEYIPGKFLASLMKERGTAPAPAVIDLGVRLCSALGVAHAAGLAHGRVHAGNIVLEAKTGRWVMLDVGHGYAVSPLEPSHDLYALAALLYEMATGHSPFEVEGAVPDPRQYKANLPAGLSGMLLRSLSPDPTFWFPSALEMAQALAKAKTQA